MDKIWQCKIGAVSAIPTGADMPMRQAVARAYREITGQDCDFIFSGWGAQLTEPERAVVENRLPDPSKCDFYGIPDPAAFVQAARGMREALEDLETREAEYRHEHDIYGDGNILTGRAWDRMRRAGDRARTALTSFRAAMGEGQSDA